MLASLKSDPVITDDPAMLNDFILKNGHLIIKDTGAEIPLTTDFARDIYRAGSFIGSVAAVRAARDFTSALKRNASRPISIAFTPKKPRPWYAIWPVCKLAGLRLVQDPEEADVLFHFEDAISFVPDTTLPLKPVLNGDCTDISKSRVANVFEQVFGYSLSIDPHTYDGLALEKSEKNGVHDGRIVPCPLETPSKSAVYQKLIDNTEDGTIYTDIRTPIVGNSIPIIYLKQRLKDARFSNENFRVVLTNPDDFLTALEQEKIRTFARAMHLDFGGLDILRDRQDGKIYIVDVNKTDMGPPTALPARDKHPAMQALADAFRNFLETSILQDS